MKNRSVASVVILTIVTFGIYGLVWEVKTKNEMNTLGADIPTAWLIIVPIANIYWLWKYCEGVEMVTKQKLSAIMSFVLFWLIGIVGMAIVQSEFNKLGGGVMAASPAAPMQPAQPQPMEPEVPEQPESPQNPTV